MNSQLGGLINASSVEHSTYYSATVRLTMFLQISLVSYAHLYIHEDIMTLQFDYILGLKAIECNLICYEAMLRVTMSPKGKLYAVCKYILKIIRLDIVVQGVSSFMVFVTRAGLAHPWILYWTYFYHNMSLTNFIVYIIYGLRAQRKWLLISVNTIVGVRHRQVSL